MLRFKATPWEQEVRGRGGIILFHSLSYVPYHSTCIPVVCGGDPSGWEVLFSPSLEILLDGNPKSVPFTFCHG
jgi:hypothetical protein